VTDGHPGLPLKNLSWVPTWHRPLPPNATIPSRWTRLDTVTSV